MVKSQPIKVNWSFNSEVVWDCQNDSQYLQNTNKTQQNDYKKYLI